MAGEATTSLPTSPDEAKVEAAREVFDEVKKLLDAGKIVRKTKAFKDCGGGADVSRAIASDKKGRARFYARSVNENATSLSFSYYYDENAKLRWVEIGGATEEGALVEANVGLSPDGARVFEDHKTVAGPDWKFPASWPEKDIRIGKPKSLFNAPNSCGELADEAPSRPKAKPKAKATAAPAK